MRRCGPFFLSWSHVHVFQDQEDEDFLAVGRAMEEIVDDPVDCYWLIKCFVNQFNNKFGDSIPHLVSNGSERTVEGKKGSPPF